MRSRGRKFNSRIQYNFSALRQLCGLASLGQIGGPALSSHEQSCLGSGGVIFFLFQQNREVPFQQTIDIQSDLQNGRKFSDGRTKRTKFWKQESLALLLVGSG